MHTLNSGRTILVSNRLPITVLEENGKLDYVPSSGGLATGLGSLTKDDSTLWIGWPGRVSKTNQKFVDEALLIQHSCVPVFLSDRLVEKYYEGFSNKTIWPLFHSFQSYAKYSTSDWRAYVEANEKFLQVLQQKIKPNDRVWIHDYQLMLLPGLLRQRFPNLSIGFFLHIPFPAFEILQLLPQYKEIMQSLLSANLIGFHTNDYSRAFLNSAHRAFGLEDQMGQLLCGERLVRTFVHPMGIDFNRFSEHSVNLEGSGLEVALQKSIADMQTIFSVSRLDYTKGIPQSIVAYERLLEKSPELIGKAALILAVVPSREKVDRYSHLKREIDENVGRVNSRFGQVGWTPIRYLYRSLTFDELILLYKNSNVALVTPLRDGLNLIAKEFVAARNDEQGVLVLSEVAGSAKELREAFLVNPNSKEEVSNALLAALRVSASEQKQKMHDMRARVAANDIDSWGKQFVEALDEATSDSRRIARDKLSGDRVQALVQTASRAARKLFVLDYDGTLMPLMDDPDEVVPDPELISILTRLSKVAEVVLLSGRNKNDLERWFGKTGVTLVAEHGAWKKSGLSKTWLHSSATPNLHWRAAAEKALRRFVHQIPGSWIEEKEYSLVWHYRMAESTSADTAVKDLVYYLLQIIGEYPVRIVPGSKSIELRSFGIGKGSFLRDEINFTKYDFTFAAGDDVTDEDMFSALPKTAFSLKIGNGFSKARFRLRSPSELRQLLLEMIRNFNNDYEEIGDVQDA